MNNQNVKYSIIVPIYNVEKYLRECIESILNQTYGAFELILVDDGSPDKCGMICDEYKEKDYRVKVIHKQNGGRLSAWISGIEQASGKYIGSIDGDDYIDSNLIQTLDEIIESQFPDIIIFGYKSVDNNHEVKMIYNIDIERGLYDKERISKFILPTLINRGAFENRSCVYLSRINKFVKSSLLRENAQYYVGEVEYGEDNLWTIPNIITANKIYVISDYYPYNYRYNSSSITHSVNHDLWKKFVCLDTITIEMLKRLNMESMIRQVYCDSVFHAAIAINNIIDSNDKLGSKEISIKNVITNDFVQKGVVFMNSSLLSLKERINLFLIRNKLVKLLLLSKIIQNRFKKGRLSKNS